MVKIRRRMDRGGWGFTARFRGSVNAGRSTRGEVGWFRFLGLLVLAIALALAPSIGRVSLRNNDGGGVWKSQGGRWRNARRGEEPSLTQLLVLLA